MRKHGILFQKKVERKNKGALVQKRLNFSFTGKLYWVEVDVKSSGAFVHGKLFKNVISKVNIILSMLKRI